ncbi:MAG: hypothetical protein C0443_09865, partial [Comamonadaceae bacterium]|nr:hypothetical protein [Comamonadaceae bacterium]
MGRMQLTNAPAWPRRQGTDLDHRGQALALLISLLAHTLLLSLSFGGAAFGLPGLSLPWAERRVTAPDLRVRLVATPGNLTAPAPVPAPAAQPLPPVPVMAAVGPRSEPTPPPAPAQTTAPVAVATPPEPLSESVPLSAPETPPVPTVAIKPSAESAAIQAPPPPEPGVPQTTPSTPPPRPTELAMLDHAEQTAQAPEAARQQASRADIARLASQRREAEQPFTIRQEEARQE